MRRIAFCPTLSSESVVEQAEEEGSPERSRVITRTQPCRLSHELPRFSVTAHSSPYRDNNNNNNSSNPTSSSSKELDSFSDEFDDEYDDDYMSFKVKPVKFKSILSSGWFQVVSKKLKKSRSETCPLVHCEPQSRIRLSSSKETDSLATTTTTTTTRRPSSWTRCFALGCFTMLLLITLLFLLFASIFESQYCKAKYGIGRLSHHTSGLGSNSKLEQEYRHGGIWNGPRHKGLLYVNSHNDELQSTPLVSP